MIEPLIELRKLSKSFDRASFRLAGGEKQQAVCGVSLRVAPGETLGLVGESGCGKSTLGRMAAGLLEPSGGEVLVKGLSLWDKKAHKDYAAFRKSLAGVVQMIFQDPYSSLNPRMSIGESVAEPLLCSDAWRRGRKVSKEEIRERVPAMLSKVGLEADAAARRPHEFSGGQRQRIAVARALITEPAFVVCDEPTSSLDASVQSQVLNLLLDLQDEFGSSYLFISHDLAVVRHMSDRIAVMREGRLVEEGGADDVFFHPAQDYTRLLLEAAS
ncbi:MAG: ATP-binding cassette domain-containing protein [Desulfovibrio sp.]|jgi:ABC-type glutathione transport system ATPase component|nr:ATP-binding cassette domain-containing protein [Desulfovibrio sp.]